jgi:D-lactate dehydrogenase (cytochrome)
LFFPVDPGADATIGGMVAMDASGTRTVRYGTMRDNTVGLTVVTAEGIVLRTAGRARTTGAGAGLTQLFAGSRGALGIVTEATLRLHARPEAVAAAVVHFPSVRAAVNTVMQAMQMGVKLERAELLDALAVRAVNACGNANLRELPTLFLEFSGSFTQVQEQSSALHMLAQDEGGGPFHWTTRQDDRVQLWKPCREASTACRRLRPGARAWTADVAVPMSALGPCIDAALDDIRHAGLVAPVFGHVGEGSFQCMMLVDPDSADEMRLAGDVARRIARRAFAGEGTCTGQHDLAGQGIDRLEDELGAGAVEVLRRIKAALDPRNILNPGKAAAPTPGPAPMPAVQRDSISSIL